MIQHIIVLCTIDASCDLSLLLDPTVLLCLFQGSVFFSFPDGTGMLYTLHGTAEAPKAVATITHEMPSKTQYTEMVPVQNWLSKPQRYHHYTPNTLPQFC